MKIFNLDKVKYNYFLLHKSTFLFKIIIHILSVYLRVRKYTHTELYSIQKKVWKNSPASEWWDRCNRPIICCAPMAVNKTAHTRTWYRRLTFRIRHKHNFSGERKNTFFLLNIISNSNSKSQTTRFKLKFTIKQCYRDIFINFNLKTTNWFKNY